VIVNVDKKMAEREGFEPSEQSPIHTLSRRAPSATRPPLRVNIFKFFGAARQAAASLSR
jgi:hypothetical protein